MMLDVEGFINRSLERDLSFSTSQRRFASYNHNQENEQREAGYERRHTP